MTQAANTRATIIATTGGRTFAVVSRGVRMFDGFDCPEAAVEWALDRGMLVVDAVALCVALRGNR